MSKFNIIPYYRNIIANDEEQKSLGYFDDCYEENEHFLLKMLCGSLDSNIVDKLSAMTLYSYINNDAFNSNAILVYFGCFAPFHDGHEYCIKSAISKIQETHNYIGGLIFPSHDNYILTKQHMEIDELRNYRALLSRYGDINTNSMIVDWFPTLLRGEINFPYLLYRAQAYVNRIEYLSRFDIFFVVGDDNKGFADIKQDNIIPIVVTRGGTHNCDITYNPFYDVSSTKLRAKQWKALLLRLGIIT